jgi:hypothetical protein
MKYLEAFALAQVTPSIAKAFPLLGGCYIASYSKSICLAVTFIAIKSKVLHYLKTFSC